MDIDVVTLEIKDANLSLQLNVDAIDLAYLVDNSINSLWRIAFLAINSKVPASTTVSASLNTNVSMPAQAE
jgi:hypothetical protein